MTVEIPACAPCPKCRERERITSVKAASVGYMQCDACGYMGPELMAKPGTPEHLFVAAVVRAWNNEPR
jgi:Zn ribbon nucleic-acid-binding protein